MNCVIYCRICWIRADSLFRRELSIRWALIMHGIANSPTVSQEPKTGILREWQLSSADDALKTAASSEAQDLCFLASVCALVLCLVLHSVYSPILSLLKDSSEPPFRRLGSGYE